MSQVIPLKLESLRNSIFMNINILELLFNLNLILLSMDHLYTGTLAMFFPKEAVKVCTKIFGVEIPETKEYFLILKPWGALGIFAGLVGLFPIFDPKKYVWILGALVVLLMLRLIYRMKFQKEAALFLKLSRERNLFHVGLILVCAFVIFAQIIFYT